MRNTGDKTLASFTSIPFSILISYLIPPRTILLILGSLLIVYPSDWFQTIKNLLSRSILLRLILLSLIDLCLLLRFHPIDRFHQLRSQLIQSSSNSSLLPSIPILLRSHFFSQPTTPDPDPEPHPASSLDPSLDPSQSSTVPVHLTVFENQRWWMGLDWTPNLLPHERPNWTDAISRPVPPPSNFKLPPPIVLPDPDQRLARKFEWVWLDSFWKIIPAHPSAGPPPSKDSNPRRSNSKNPPAPIIPTHTTPPWSPDPANPQNHQRSASQTSSIGFLDSEIINESLRSSGLTPDITHLPDPNVAWDVDSDGWQYGDNHWEKMSKKSGMGRYTRRRAWTRKAALVTRIIPSTESSSPSTDSKQGDESGPVASSPPLSTSPSASHPTATDDHPSSPSLGSSSISIHSTPSFSLFRRKK